MPLPVDIHFVKRAESKLGRKLPLSYVAQIYKQNGGSVDAGPDSWELYPILDDSDRKRLKRTCNDIVLETKNATGRPGYPDNAVAIGSNGGGDLLVFVAQASADRFGDEVYWWDHETDELNKVADDFLDLRHIG